MKLVCVSDTHNHTPSAIPDGDVLIHAGDGTGNGSAYEVARVAEWMQVCPHPHKLYIPGNHDWLFEREPSVATYLMKGIEVLVDRSYELPQGVLVYGTPWHLPYKDWAFQLMATKLERVFNKIPDAVDILITHAPPHGILDTERNRQMGCEVLRRRLEQLEHPPIVHVFGHIHGGYGVMEKRYRDTRPTTCVNASYCDPNYRPGNQPIVVELL